MAAVWAGLSQCYAALAEQVRQRYDVDLTSVGALGVSAMMHGYLAFDADGRLLTPFRTWRNTNTREAAERLSAEFGHNIPHRWSVAHLYQAVLNGEDHVGQIGHLTTLAGYVHWQLTGEKVLGIGDASGMFPIDIATGSYEPAMLRHFDQLAAEDGVGLALADLLPIIRLAGEPAGALTESGARLLDPTGRLRPGVPMCPPEGDAGTGMVATNSVAPRTGNVSAGTSIFAMVVLEHELSRVHKELDLVTTPAGDLVAMVHCNNGASELNSWVGLFAELAAALGARTDRSAIFETLFTAALDGAPDGGGLMSYNYLSGEPITGLEEGARCFSGPPTAPSIWPTSRVRSCSPPWPPCGSGWMCCRRKRGYGWTGCSRTADSSRRRASRRDFWPPPSTRRFRSATSPPRAAPGESRSSPRSSTTESQSAVSTTS